ncbi:hypothetical protein LAJ19_07645 [Deinococcus taeanensis]|uniref:hypothetical protein n=1 Tax=Deinococcus taeanensis TaxID=2737050 RepID=UPI001CDC8B95|nr:hypothetical protein [Deinococcus taeanensis]UBV41540.1 hypothetical protein LAJ19_07645 [Deinococcus taeanensis]
MNKVTLAALSLTGLLASCGSLSSGPDGSEKLLSVTTEYTTGAPATPALCDQLNGAASKSQLVIGLSASGTIQNVKVNLKDSAGTVVSTTDVPGGSLLKGAQDGQYLIALDRTASKSLTVSSTVRPTGAVTVGAAPTAALTAEVIITRSRSSVTVKNDTPINVYASCTKA